MPGDIRQTKDTREPQTSSGGGAAMKTGYAAGGLGQGGDRAHHGEDPQVRNWDAPGVTPDGHRTGSSTEGPRTAMDGEGEDNPERWAQSDDDEAQDG